MPDAVARHVQRCLGTSFQELAAFCKQPHDGWCPLFPETEEGIGNNTSLLHRTLMVAMPGRRDPTRPWPSSASWSRRAIGLGAKTSRYGSQSNLRVYHASTCDGSIATSPS